MIVTIVVQKKNKKQPTTPNKATVFLFVGLHCICWNFKVRQLEKKTKKNLLMYSSTPVEFFIMFLTTSKKYEICLQDNLGHGFLICWITLHLLKFQSVANRKKTHWCTCQLQQSSYYISDNFSKKKVWDMLTRQLRLFFYLLD